VRDLLEVDLVVLHLVFQQIGSHPARGKVRKGDRERREEEKEEKRRKRIRRRRGEDSHLPRYFATSTHATCGGDLQRLVRDLLEVDLMALHFVLQQVRSYPEEKRGGEEKRWWEEVMRRGDEKRRRRRGGGELQRLVRDLLEVDLVLPACSTGTPVVLHLVFQQIGSHPARGKVRKGDRERREEEKENNWGGEEENNWGGEEENNWGGEEEENRRGGEEEEENSWGGEEEKRRRRRASEARARSPRSSVAAYPSASQIVPWRGERWEEEERRRRKGDEIRRWE
jgi:hypothetical protein